MRYIFCSVQAIAIVFGVCISSPFEQFAASCKRDRTYGAEIIPFFNKLSLHRVKLQGSMS
jgi:hypothetical protein